MGGQPRTADQSPVRYHERLRVTWWWWPLGLLVGVAAIGPLAAMAAHPVASAGLLALLPLAAAGLWWLGRVRVAVVGDELWVDDARLPLRYVAQVVPLDAAGRAQLLGPAADPRAFVVQRPWARGAVQVVLADPDDPTPYWLVSTAAPEKLAAALTGDRTG